MATRHALITGITGQDGSYLAEFLLTKGYRVSGLIHRQPESSEAENIAQIRDQVSLHEGDLGSDTDLETVVTAVQPDEIYNLAGITFVPQAWEHPTRTFNINTLGVMRLLDYLRTHPTTRLFQASSARMFGHTSITPQNEQTPLQPFTDPYSLSKTAAHQVIQGIRTKDHLFAASGILYNHESIRRGPEFVTRKITRAAARIKYGHEHELYLGDLHAKQDWGYAPDYVEAMWLMLQQDQPDDYVIATGIVHSVADICAIAFGAVGLNWQDYVRIDDRLIRPQESTQLVGDAHKAHKELSWTPRVTFEEMITKMVEYDQEHTAKELHG